MLTRFLMRVPDLRLNLHATAFEQGINNPDTRMAAKEGQTRVLDCGLLVAHKACESLASNRGDSQESNPCSQMLIASWSAETAGGGEFVCN